MILSRRIEDHYKVVGKLFWPSEDDFNQHMDLLRDERKDIMNKIKILKKLSPTDLSPIMFDDHLKKPTVEQALHMLKLKLTFNDEAKKKIKEQRG